MERLDKQTTRYDNIDLLEFLGMLLVIVYHYDTVKYNILDDSSIWVYINYLIMPIMSVHVPLFFFCNGFLLINKPLRLKAHIIKMAKYILLTEIWSVINLLALMPINDEWLSIREFAVASFKLKQNWTNFLWYMGALICVYIFFPLIKNAFDHHKAVFNYWVVICSLFVFGNSLLRMLATLVSHYAMGGTAYISTNFFGMFNPFRGLHGHTFAYFSIGCFVGGNRLLIQEKVSKCRAINRISLSAVILVSTLLLGLWGVFATNLTGSILDVVWDVTFNGFDTVFTLVNVLAIYLLSTCYRYTGSFIDKCIQLISKNTLGIYFLHMIFLHIFFRAGIALLPIAHNYVFAVIYAVFIMTLCLFTIWLIKRIPILKWLVT